MKIAELEKRVYAHTPLIDYIEEQQHVEHIAENTARINPCPICGRQDHFTVKKDKNYWTVFYACSDNIEGVNGGGLYKYLLYVEELSEKAAKKKLHNLAEVEYVSDYIEDEFDIIGDLPDEDIKKDPPQEEVTGLNKMQQLIPQLYQKQSEKDKEYFLKERGLPNNIVDKYQLSVYEKDGDKRAVLPIYESGQIVSYIERLITGKKQYLNRKGPARMFNIDYLKADSDTPVVITESVFDALTMEARGFNAIALNGVQNVDRFKDAVIRHNAKDKMMLSGFDNDQAGRSAAKKLGYPVLEIPKEYKDLNEWSVAEIEAYKAGNPIPPMQKSLAAQIENGRQPDNLSYYLENKFQDEIDHLREFKDRKTGFSNLDEELKGVYPGLNVVGAITGGGKTTFVLQLADQMAKAGEHVLFFSLEQSKLELASKSLARTTAENDLNDAVASIQIRSGWQTQSVKQALNDYSDTAKHMNIIEGNFNTNAETIRKTTERYIQLNKVTPVVVVDYLQIIPGVDDSMNDKQRLDTNVRILKQMSRDLNITIFAISSLNRGNYLAPVDFESFKESGGIEYTADMIWGLQLEVIHSDLFDKQNKVKEKRAAISRAMKQEPRNIELVSLKNRNGKARFSCTFDYWAKHDYFEAATAPKEFKAITEESESPFDFDELLAEPEEKEKPEHADADIFDNADLMEAEMPGLFETEEDSAEMIDKLI